MTMEQKAQIGYNAIRRYRGQIRVPRKFPVPKTGVFILASIAALSGLIGAGTSIAKAMHDAAIARKQLEEEKRHNEVIELGKTGSGMYLRRFRKGFKLYLDMSKNSSRKQCH